MKDNKRTRYWASVRNLIRRGRFSRRPRGSTVPDPPPVSLDDSVPPHPDSPDADGLFSDADAAIMASAFRNALRQWNPDVDAIIEEDEGQTVRIVSYSLLATHSI